MAATSTEPVTIALVEDDDDARQRLVASIRSDPSLRLVGEYGTAADSLAALESGEDPVSYPITGISRDTSSPSVSEWGI